MYFLHKSDRILYSRGINCCCVIKAIYFDTYISSGKYMEVQMNISFHLGSSSTNYENVVLISQILSRTKLEVLTFITEKAHSLYRIEKNAYKTEAGETAFSYNLTIFLPEKDENSAPYGSFEHLFDHDNYYFWKKSVLDQFVRTEKKAMVQQELSRRYKELALLSGKTATRMIEQRIDELKQQLYPDSSSKH